MPNIILMSLSATLLMAYPESVSKVEDWFPDRMHRFKDNDREDNMRRHKHHMRHNNTRRIRRPKIDNEVMSAETAGSPPETTTILSAPTPEYSTRPDFDGETFVIQES
jgi:hypothetical protein